VPKRTPPRPDFEAIEAAARKHVDKQTVILALIGNLALSWSNNESMFIHVLEILMDTDRESAAIVFATLNTTRARLDLVQRLARRKIADRDLMKSLDRIMERFNSCTKIRNEFNHCTYKVSDQGEITETRSLKIQDVRGRMQIETVKKMDAARINEMAATVRDLKKVNRDLWDFLPRLEEHLDEVRNKNPEGGNVRRVDGEARPASRR